MRLVEIDTSQYSPSNIGFASSLVAKACRYTGTDINIRTDEGTWVNLKSIMGVLTLNYSKLKKSHFKLWARMKKASLGILLNLLRQISRSSVNNDRRKQ